MINRKKHFIIGFIIFSIVLIINYNIYNKDAYKSIFNINKIKTFCLSNTTNIKQIKTITVTITISPSLTPKPTIIKINNSNNITKIITNLNLTSVSCLELPDMTGICIYNNICYDGNQRIYIIDKLKVNKEIEEEIRIPDEEYITMGYDDRYRLPIHYPIPKMKYIPYAENNLSPESRLISLEYFNNNYDKIYISGTSWFTSPLYENRNPYYFPKDNNQLYEIEWWNNTNPNIFIFPSFENIIFVRHLYSDYWQLNMTLFYKRNYPNSIIWTKDNFKQNSTKEVLYCFNKAIILSDKPEYWSGNAVADSFRYELKKYINYSDNSFNNIPKLTIINRAVSRQFINLSDIIKLGEHYKLDISIIPDFTEHMDLKEQALLLQDTQVYIVAHGAAEANNMFLNKNASIIEIFPYGMKNAIFERQIRTMGLNYFPIHSWIKPEPIYNWQLYTEWYYKYCENLSSIERNDAQCILPIKNAQIYVPLRPLEQALIEAYYILGYNIISHNTKQFIETISFIENNPYKSSNFIRYNKTESFFPSCYSLEKGNNCYDANPQ